ncbi:MAG: 3-deoxy-D-manno-octulosonate 8-phosphate phosphatase [Actinobacteria bacterium]|nr:3-deoxy-D-manno-octulosonate 8-phosphate phosphatase [Actinomycetota bacterium]
MTTKSKVNSQICKKISLILTDVDGVLTDGSRYYSKNGENIKKFHVRDGMGINILLRNDIKTIIVTKERSEIVKKWAKDVNIHRVLMGIKNKETVLTKLCKEFNLQPNQIAFIGDDVNDLPLLKLVGISASPCDAINQVKNSVKYVCTCNGGQGAFREFADFILTQKFSKKLIWY